MHAPPDVPEPFELIVSARAERMANHMKTLLADLDVPERRVAALAQFGFIAATVSRIPRSPSPIGNALRSAIRTQRRPEVEARRSAIVGNSAMPARYEKRALENLWWVYTALRKMASSVKAHFGPMIRKKVKLTSANINAGLDEDARRLFMHLGMTPGAANIGAVCREQPGEWAKAALGERLGIGRDAVHSALHRRSRRPHTT